MSNIGDYQALIAAATVDFTDQASNARSIAGKAAATLVNTVQASALPVRLLLPYSDRDEMSARMGEFSIGNEATITWRFVDQMLWRPTGLGYGLSDSSQDLREYCAAYFTMALGLDASSISDRMALESVELQIRDDILFPRADTGIYYIGVDAVWTVTEDDPL